MEYPTLNRIQSSQSSPTPKVLAERPDLVKRLPPDDYGRRSRDNVPEQQRIPDIPVCRFVARARRRPFVVEYLHRVICQPESLVGMAPRELQHPFQFLRHPGVVVVQKADVWGSGEMYSRVSRRTRTAVLPQDVLHAAVSQVRFAHGGGIVGRSVINDQQIKRLVRLSEDALDCLREEPSRRTVVRRDYY